MTAARKPVWTATVLTLLPGSRRNEIAAHLGIQLETAHLLHAERPEVRFLLAVAPSLGDGAEIRSACDRARDSGLSITLLRGRSREAIVAADVVLAKPGTVTMECALLARPMVVMGRANALTAWFLRRAIRVSRFAIAVTSSGPCGAFPRGFPRKSWPAGPMPLPMPPGARCPVRNHRPE